MRLDEAAARLGHVEAELGRLDVDSYGRLAELRAEVAQMLKSVYGEAESWSKDLDGVPTTPANLPEKSRKYMGNIERVRWDRAISALRALILQGRQHVLAIEGSLTLLHPTIQLAAAQQMRDGHFKSAALDAQLALSTVIKNALRSKGDDPHDSANLLHKAREAKLFSLPHDEKYDPEIPEGYVMIFRGAYTAVRNPKAHEWFEVSSERALHFLFLASLLVAKCEEAGMDARL